jgi:hypothetical protein
LGRRGTKLTDDYTYSCTERGFVICAGHSGGWGVPRVVKCIRGQRDPWEDIGVDERIVSSRSQRRSEGSDWRLAQDRDISVAGVITVMNLVFRAREGMYGLAEEL